MRGAVTIASDRAAAIDGAALTALIAAILAGADHPTAMLVAVAAIGVARTAAWTCLPPAERGGLAGELALLVLATALGAANDWNTVVVHGVYDYTVPHGLPLDRAIPPWMLLAWGLILRGLITLSRWRRLGPPDRPDDRVGLFHRRPRPLLRVLVLLALVGLTRLAVYRWAADDPLLSWSPMAMALLAHAALFGMSAHTLRFVAIVAVAGTALEALLIQAAGLHHYPLGWLAGVPLWIALWWPLGALIWCELAARLAAATGAELSGRSRPG